MVSTKTKIVIGFIIVAVIGLAIGNKIYNDNDYLSLVLVCDFNSKYTNYDETLEFNYVSNTLYEYVRYESMRPTEKTTIDEIKKLFKDQYKEIQDNLSDYFKYEITESDDEVKVKTYIKTIFNEDFYNSYIEEKGIDMDSTIDEVENKLSDEYTCQREKRG